MSTANNTDGQTPDQPEVPPLTPQQVNEAEQLARFLDPDLQAAVMGGNATVIQAIAAGAQTTQQVVDMMLRQGALPDMMPPGVRELLQERLKENALKREEEESFMKKLAAGGIGVAMAVADPNAAIAAGQRAAETQRNSSSYTQGAALESMAYMSFDSWSNMSYQDKSKMLNESLSKIQAGIDEKQHQMDGRNELIRIDQQVLTKRLDTLDRKEAELQRGLDGFLTAFCSFTPEAQAVHKKFEDAGINQMNAQFHLRYLIGDELTKKEEIENPAEVERKREEAKKWLANLTPEQKAATGLDKIERDLLEQEEIKRKLEEDRARLDSLKEQQRKAQEEAERLKEAERLVTESRELVKQAEELRRQGKHAEAQKLEQQAHGMAQTAGQMSSGIVKDKSASLEQKVDASATHDATVQSRSSMALSESDKRKLDIETADVGAAKVEARDLDSSQQIKQGQAVGVKAAVVSDDLLADEPAATKVAAAPRLTINGAPLAAAGQLQLEGVGLEPANQPKATDPELQRRQTASMGAPGGGMG